MSPQIAFLVASWQRTNYSIVFASNSLYKATVRACNIYASLIDISCGDILKNSKKSCGIEIQTDRLWNILRYRYCVASGPSDTDTFRFFVNTINSCYCLWLDYDERLFSCIFMMWSDVFIDQTIHNFFHFFQLPTFYFSCRKKKCTVI